MKVLYFSNCEVPYRKTFFNELSKHCDLTVLYQYSKSVVRNDEWTNSVENDYKTAYLNPGATCLRKSDYFKVIKYLFFKYDRIIIGCYNDPICVFCIILMKLLHIPYIINLDGETFFTGRKKRVLLKKFLLNGAKAYVVAGESAKKSLIDNTNAKKVFSYPFTSLTKAEIDKNREQALMTKKNDTVLVVSRWIKCKALDVMMKAVKSDSTIQWKLIGLDFTTERFKKYYNTDEITNLEIIPFLQKEDISKEYLNCGVFVLPSRRECWGLVINEAASYGTPIISTYGSGAAVEFLSSSEYSEYLVPTNDFEAILEKVRYCLNNDMSEYSNFLLEKSKSFTIEKCVEVHIDAINSY